MSIQAIFISSVLKKLCDQNNINFSYVLFNRKNTSALKYFLPDELTI